ncbi:monocarboxylate transporter 13-like [Amphiura filiformis]|uniref:monocarboxylate transporter 13-like n=1 Tax=Amphiura filiformis TaxID=82378 RepID=UPI003B2142C4
MSQKDTCRSCIVLFGSSVLMFIETGIVKSLGVLLPDIREQFSTQTWVIGFVISLTPGFGAVVCLLSGAISKVLEPRLTIILCAVLCSIGLFVTAFSTNLYAIATTLLLTGFATGTTSVAGGALSQYFDKYYNFAATVFLAGMSLGMVVMPLLTQILVDIYGWRGTILLLTGISLHGVICGAVFKPNTPDEYTQLSSPVSLTGTNSANQCANRQRLATCLDEYLDMNLFSKSTFIAMICLFAGNGFYTTGWLIYVVPHVIEVGFNPYEASLVATVGGFANFVGNFIHPLVEKILSNTAQLYTSLFMITASFAFDAVATIYFSYFGLITCALLFGLGRGLMLTAFYPIMKEVIDEDKMINAMGWLYAMYGLTSVCSGFTCGWLYDQSGNYVLTFLVLAAVCLVTMIPQCLLSGATSKVLGPRLTIILCAILCSIGLFSTAFATNLYVIAMTLLLIGFSTGTSSVAGGALSQYFDKYYDLAATASLSGWLYDQSGSYTLSFLTLSLVCIVTSIPRCIQDIKATWK